MKVEEREVQVFVVDRDSGAHSRNVDLLASVRSPAGSSSLPSSASEDCRETRAKAASSVMKLSSAS